MPAKKSAANAIRNFLAIAVRFISGRGYSNGPSQSAKIANNSESQFRNPLFPSVFFLHHFEPVCNHIHGVLLHILAVGVLVVLDSAHDPDPAAFGDLGKVCDI